jgi:hypothetical protein
MSTEAREPREPSSRGSHLLPARKSSLVSMLLPLEPLIAFFGVALIVLILVVVAGVIIGRRFRRRDEQEARRARTRARTDAPSTTDEGPTR